MKKSLVKRLVTILVVMFAVSSLFSTSAFAAPSAEDAISGGGGAQDNSLTPEEVIALSSDSELKKQQAIEEAILAEYRKGNFTLENPLVKVDPFGTAPLSALVVFDTEGKTRVGLLVKGKGSNVDIKHSFTQFDTHHEIPVYGLYPDFNNTITITTYTQDGQEKQQSIQIKTKPLPDKGTVTSYNPKVMVKNEDQMADGLTFTVQPGAHDYATVVAYDKNGDIRSVLTCGGMVTPIRRLDNGHIQVASNKAQRPIYFQASIYEIDLMGKIYKEYLRNGIHHDARKLANGNYLVVCEKAGRDTTEDFIVELDAKTGMKVREWDLKEIFKMYKYEGDPSYKYNAHDWLHINSLWPVPGEDAILISGRHQDGFFKIDLGKSELVWAMTAPSPNYREELSNKLLTPIGDNFEYVWGQHAISMLPDNKIFVFDNGNGRSKDPNKFWDTNDPRNYSRAVIYRIDEENMTVEQLWQYGKERGLELFSRYICDVDYLGQNHYLIDFGGCRDANGNQKATIVEIKNDEVVWELKLDGNFYRVERMKAYEFDKEYELTKHPGVQLGVLFTTEDHTITQ